ncbi:hypothetical protein HHI36_010797 [Cryptolaemus montrouzieri]|uniref:Uncharacterized protein n=1 Tax=Cryptolaemus montrouzieri TaxID=559131 RepID=A0ABD2MJQ0_9CUCU
MSFCQNNTINPTVSLRESENVYNIGGYGHTSDLEQHPDSNDEPAFMGSRDQVILNRCTNSSPIESSPNVEIVTPEMARPFPKAPPRKKKATLNQKLLKIKQDPKLKDAQKENVPGKPEGKKTLNTEQRSEQKLQRKKTGKSNENKNVNDESETEYEDENVLYDDSSSNSDFAETPEVNDRWYCFVCEPEEIMTMRLWRS